MPRNDFGPASLWGKGCQNSSLKMALHRMWRDQSGAAAVFIAVGLIPMIGAVGFAEDSSLAYLLKSRLSKSLDTAGLAAGRVALRSDAADVARDYFDAIVSSARFVDSTIFRRTVLSTQTFPTHSFPTYFRLCFVLGF